MQIYIPPYHKPTIRLTINGVKYEYPSGKTVDVPDNVAAVIRNMIANDPSPFPEDSVTSEPLYVSSNGDYWPPEGTYYNYVNVRVQGEGIPPEQVNSMFIERQMATYTNDTATTIGSYAFCKNDVLHGISMPSVHEIGEGAFEGCNQLTEANLYSAQTIGNGAFKTCTVLQQIRLPKAMYINRGAFSGCTSLRVVYLGGDDHLCEIGESAFYNTDLLALVIRKVNEYGVTISPSAFENTPITMESDTGKGYIYVLSRYLDMVSQALGNAQLQSRLRAFEDYSTTGDELGDLDWDKINAAE